MNTEEMQMKLNGLKEIQLEPVKEQFSDFVDTLPERYAEAVDQVKRRLGLKPRSRREAFRQWMDQHRWMPIVPIALGVGLVATIVLVTRAHVQEW